MNMNTAQATQPVAEYEGIQGRICKLLGQGIEGHRVASALGVDPSYVSQLLADDAFKERVQELRLANLTEATTRDKRYDGIEDKLLGHIEHDIDKNPFAFKTTGDKVRALSIVNNLKRRGANADSNIATINQTVVQLVLPTQLMQRYVKDVNNQIVQAGDKNLLTMQSGSMSDFANQIDIQNNTDKITDKSANKSISKVSYYE